jgi:hypothetical protein
MDRDLRAILYADDCPEINPRVEPKLGLHKLTTMANPSKITRFTWFTKMDPRIVMVLITAQQQQQSR